MPVPVPVGTRKIFQCCHFDTSYNLFHLSSVDDFVSFIYTGKAEKVVLKPYDLKELTDVAESELLLEMISIGEARLSIFLGL